MISKEVFDKELVQVRRVYTQLSERYELEDLRIGIDDSNHVYSLLDSSDRLIRGLTKPIEHPDVLTSPGVREEENRRLGIIRENLSSVIDILARYENQDVVVKEEI